MMRRLEQGSPTFSAELAALVALESALDPEVDAAVAKILAAVRAEGDTALIEYTRRFDRWTPTSISELEIPIERCQTSLADLPAKLRAALNVAADRIRRYHDRQKLESWQYTEPDGTVLGQQITPLDRVGLYVPGGKAAYPSSVLMNAIAAKVAGVREIIMVTPTPEAGLNDMVLAAAALVGVDRVFRVGGAQAVGALAHGTALVPAVDKIVGPGNAYVAAAKRRVFGTVGIDMVAGPSEILIICDGSSPPDWVALDLFSQAEHDEIAQSILLCPDGEFLDRVAVSIERLLPAQPRADIIRASLMNRGALIQVESLEAACALSNELAPEHLELSVTDPEALLANIRHAGAIFLGRFSSESIGDYCAGPNHVLPTSRTARFSSPLGVYDFQKRSSLVKVSPAGAKTLGQIAATLARTEGLEAHAQSAECRFSPVTPGTEG
ncbi:MAG: histidinol dehydrogenase [Betaproteobacteria bacterium]|nr:histidinol dehydrogenase [Betaproteobacteria bacterium]